MLKSFFAKIYAGIVSRQVYSWAQDPINTQNKVFKELISQASKTKFGRDHKFVTISNYQDYKKLVPVRDYEGLKGYINDIQQGELDVLWKGRPLYFAKTSGTTSGAKYIPITKESMPYQISAAKEALLLYIAETGKADFVDGKMIFLQGSPEIDDSNKVQTGRLSGKPGF